MQNFVEIIGYIITGCFSLAGAYLMVRKRDQEQDLKTAVLFQSIEDRLKSLEEEMRNRRESDTRLMKVEQICIELKKDMEYLKKGLK